MFDMRSFMDRMVDGGVRLASRFRLSKGLVLACLLVACGYGLEARAQDGSSEVTIPDEGLRCTIAEALGKSPDEAVTAEEMATLEDLSSSCDLPIVDLTGLEHAASLLSLKLPGNAISDLEPLTELTALEVVDLADNAIADITPLSGLTALDTLNLLNNRIADVEPLARLTDLSWLRLDGNAISDVGPLAGLTALYTLDLSRNRIADIDALAGLTRLHSLILDNNAISDIGPLASLAALHQLWLNGNLVADVEPLSHLGLLERLDLSRNAITRIDPLSSLTRLTLLNLSNNSVADLEPLAPLTGLTWLVLYDNAISDIEPLAGMASLAVLNVLTNAVTDIGPLSNLEELTWLSVHGNKIEDVEPLSGLTLLQVLDVGANAIEDIEALSALTALGTLHIGGNSIVSIDPLEGLTGLTWLSMYRNGIQNLDPLEGLTELTRLNLDGNAIVDLEPLAGLTGLQVLSARDNPLGAASISGPLQHLREAGTIVYWDWEHAGREVVWFVPSARDPTRQGFVRLINHSDEAGAVTIVAIDDQGRRHDPISLAVGANETVHFNSNDLEAGNRNKGLSGGTGPGDGDWRLELLSELELTALSYMRTADGFLTSIHDVVPVLGNGYRIVTFNPGSNLNQASRLRLSNPGTEEAEVTIWGVDDSGDSPGAPVRVDIPAGASVTLTASDLESGAGLDGALGDGTGKWRLRLEPTQPIVAMSLLSSPTGNLTNLSTVAGWAAGGYRVPLFPTASDGFGPQGFVRMRNYSDKAGLVRIDAYDDSDRFHKAVVHLRIGAGETRHFNSEDFERGNEAKGLIGIAGPTLGDWVLKLSSRLDIEASSYIRTPDGFLTSMHDVVRRNDGAADVMIFNPGSNRRQVSRLRIYNHGTREADVRITAWDDGGEPGSPVTLTVPGRASRTISAAELEFGGAGLEGGLGDGRGKWRLRVESKADLSVMHLLSNPTGHLTNLSAAPD